MTAIFFGRATFPDRKVLGLGHLNLRLLFVGNLKTLLPLSALVLIFLRLSDLVLGLRRLNLGVRIFGWRGPRKILEILVLIDQVGTLRSLQVYQLLDILLRL